MTTSRPTDIGAELMAACTGAVGNPPAFSGRGIVVCAGGGRMLTNAYVLVRTLRDTLGCTLPIEIWHMGAMEMPPLIAGLLEGFGCRIVDANEVRNTHPAAIHDGWQLKSYALLHSAFDDTILLDADQVPVTDPEEIFEWPEYRRAGAVFWPDIIEISERNPVWALVGLEPRDIISWETGQVAVGKTRHWRALCLAFEINQRAEVFYELVYGDKDTFLIAWLMAAAECAVVPHPPFSDQKCLVQRDFSGNGIFQHRTNCKWSLHESPERPPDFRFQDACEGYLENLREVWNGFVFTPPPRPLDAMERERELVSAGAFTRFVGDAPPENVTFLEGHQIGEGRDFHWSNWYIDAAEGGYRLIVCDRSKPDFTLSKGPDGCWHGHALSASRQEVVLQPRHAQPGPVAPGRGGLVEAFIDAARRGGTGEPLDRGSLAGALRLLERVEPGTIEMVAALAADRRDTDPGLAATLEEIVARLRDDTRPEGERPRDRSAHILGNPDLYRAL